MDYFTDVLATFLDLDSVNYIAVYGRVRELSEFINYKDNYKDNDISVHTSKQYRLFILSARSSAALNSQARDNRMDSDWLSIFLSFISWKKSFWKWFQRYRFSVPLSL